MSKKMQYFLVFLVPFVWGTTMPMSKHLFDEANFTPGILLFIRFAIALMVMAVYVGKKYGFNMSRQNKVNAFLIGSLLAMGYVFQFQSVDALSTPLVAVANSLVLVFVPAISIILFKEKIKKRIIFASLIALSAATLSVYDALTGGSAFAGLTMITFIIALMAPIFYSMQNVLGGKIVDKKVSQIQFTFFMFIAAFIVIAVYTLISYQPGDIENLVWSPETIASILFLALFATALPFIIRQVLFKYMTPTKVTLFFSSELVFTTLFALVYGEAISNMQFVSIGLMAIAICVAETIWRHFGFNSKKCKPITK